MTCTKKCIEYNENCLGARFSSEDVKFQPSHSEFDNKQFTLYFHKPISKSYFVEIKKVSSVEIKPWHHIRVFSFSTLDR